MASAQVYNWTNFVGQPGCSGSSDGTGIAARFYYPSGVALDTGGNVFVADELNYTIRKVTPGGVVTTLAGSAGVWGSTDGADRLALFGLPAGLAVDNSGNVYVADRRGNTIRKVHPAGVVTTLAGIAFNQGYIDGTGTEARFSQPYAVAVDNFGNVYVADCYNNAIRRVTSGGFVTTLAGGPKSPSGIDGTGSEAGFNWPKGVALDSDGNVYVADTYDYTIRKVTAEGVVTTVAGSAGVCGSTDGTGGTALFNLPRGVAVDSAGNVYVADYGNDTIRKVTAAGVAMTIGGLAGVQGTADGIGPCARFYNPGGVAVDAAGNLYVADLYNHRISKGTPIGIGITNVSLSNTSAVSGQVVRVSFTVNNVGSVRCAPCTNTVYWSTDPAVSTSDTQLAYWDTSSIPANGSQTVAVGFAVPDGVIAGRTYYIGVIADTSGTSGEPVVSTPNGVAITIATPSSRMTPSVQLGDFYYSQGPATDTSPLGYRTPLILVHGGGNDARPDSDNYWYWWLEYLNTAPASSMFKVYRYVYDTRLPISQDGTDLANFVKNRAEFADRQVILLAHSMGGLVCRDAMKDNTFRSSVAKLVTLATPHLGSPGANPPWILYCYPPLDAWDFLVNVGERWNFKDTDGGFDLAWYDPTQMPAGTDALSVFCEPPFGPYQANLLDAAMQWPFLSSTEMTTSIPVSKIVAFGGCSGIALITGPADDMLETWGDHAALWPAYQVMAGVYNASGEYFVDNDGLVPLDSSLFATSLTEGLNAYNLSARQFLNKRLDHVSFMDDAQVINSVGNYLQQLATASRRPGDINGDGSVDVIDLLYLVDAFGSVTGDTNYDPAADFNSDGSVDVIDLLTLVENFGT